MRVAIPRETFPGERRVAATPDTVGRLLKLGFEVSVEAGAGVGAGFADALYEAEGAQVVAEVGALYAEADLVAKVREPNDDEIALMKEGTVLVALLWALQNPDLVERLAKARISAISLDRIPRISRAQKMDVLSSMANIAGYRAVIEAATVLPRFMGGQITAAGKTRPARVLVIGAGVAGLAAIGAARSMGAEVYAFDTRAAVREQVQSMGARFLEVSVKESGDGAGGYAKVMS
ncbi:MAG: NAD(P)(+) transhydrogenase (Re/Si-specific) subunit alpha, partial [Myxococcota bacterium]